MPDPAIPAVPELRALSLFEGIKDEQLAQLLESSQVEVYSPGQILFAGPDPAEHWWVNLEGNVDFVAFVGGEEMVYAQFIGPGRWAGGHRAWDDEGVYLGEARATTAGRVLKVPTSALRDLLWSLPLVPHLIDGLVRSVRSVDASIRQREAVLSLGAVSAGLAHELNNPASAATRAAASLRDTVREVLSSVDRIAAGDLSHEQFAALAALRGEISQAPVSASPMAVSDREDELSAWLAAHDVERGWIIGPTLAVHGVDTAWCERLGDAFDGAALQAGLEWVVSTLTVASLVDEVEESTRRVSDLVAAVKSYSQMDRSSQQRIDVTEGLESTLAMLGSQLRDVVVVRRYGLDVPEVVAIPGELNQVWTIIIDNALDAMGGTGTLTLSTSAEGSEILVEIRDDGVGMTSEVALRAFDAFFTTKDVGAGTGLGLDIARRIVVQRHGGTIAIESQPGDTAVLVRLPIRGPASQRASA